MILHLTLTPTHWPSSRATKFLRHPGGWSLPPRQFVLADWAASAGKLPELSTVISGLVAVGEASGWQLASMLISEAGRVQIFDGEALAGERLVLELAVTLAARHDHPDAAVRGLSKSDTWTSETLPPDVRDALLALWEALQ